MGAAMASGICQTDEVPLLENDGEIELYEAQGNRVRVAFGLFPVYLL